MDRIQLKDVALARPPTGGLDPRLVPNRSGGNRSRSLGCFSLMANLPTSLAAVPPTSLAAILPATILLTAPAAILPATILSTSHAMLLATPVDSEARTAFLCMDVVAGVLRRHAAKRPGGG